MPLVPNLLGAAEHNIIPPAIGCQKVSYLRHEYKSFFAMLPPTFAYMRPHSVMCRLSQKTREGCGRLFEPFVSKEKNAFCIGDFSAFILLCCTAEII